MDLRTLHRPFPYILLTLRSLNSLVLLVICIPCCCIATVSGIWTVRRTWKAFSNGKCYNYRLFETRAPHIRQVSCTVSKLNCRTIRSLTGQLKGYYHCILFLVDRPLQEYHETRVEHAWTSTQARPATVLSVDVHSI